jgi:hypothetical protein
MPSVGEIRYRRINGYTLNLNLEIPAVIKTAIKYVAKGAIQGILKDEQGWPDRGASGV